MKKQKFYKEDEFRNYSSNAYVKYMHHIIKLFKDNNISKLFSDIEASIKLDKSKTLSFLENASQSIKTIYKNPRYNFQAIQSKKSLQDYNSALNKYVEFLRTNEKKYCGRKKWFQNYKDEDELVFDLAYNISGIDSLLKHLGVKDPFVFVEKVLSDCIFFNKDDVKNRFNYICTQYNSVNPKMIARWTQEYLSKYPNKTKNKIKYDSQTTFNIQYNDGNKYIPVEIDSDGNKAVRELIKAKTGYIVSNGEKSNIKNYKISHIWGNASDPRYFTNLWNIVLVPAWANDLLDKTNSNDPLTVVFQEIIKYVCIKHYDMQSLNWGSINLVCPIFSNNVKNLYSGKKLNIKVFNNIGENGLAQIKNITITVI